MANFLERAPIPDLCMAPLDSMAGGAQVRGELPRRAARRRGQLERAAVQRDRDGQGWQGLAHGTHLCAGQSDPVSDHPRHAEERANGKWPGVGEGLEVCVLMWFEWNMNQGDIGGMWIQQLRPLNSPTPQPRMLAVQADRPQEQDEERCAGIGRPGSQRSALKGMLDPISAGWSRAQGKTPRLCQDAAGRFERRSDACASRGLFVWRQSLTLLEAELQPLVMLHPLTAGSLARCFYLLFASIVAALFSCFADFLCSLCVCCSRHRTLLRIESQYLHSNQGWVALH